jgi:hypothetical protein
VPIITPSGSGGGAISAAVTTLSAAQILGKTTVTAVAAPGATFAVVPYFAVFSYIAGATPFTVDGTTAIGIDPIGWLALGAQGFIDQAASQFRFRLIPNESAASSGIAGQPLVIDWGGTAPTLGNGSLVVTIDYALVQVG